AHRAALQSGAVAPDATPAPRPRHHHVRRARPGHGPERHGQAHRRRRSLARGQHPCRPRHPARADRSGFRCGSSRGRAPVHDRARRGQPCRGALRAGARARRRSHHQRRRPARHRWRRRGPIAVLRPPRRGPRPPRRAGDVPAADRLVAHVVRSARIIGWGTALPDKVVTNHDLEQTLDTSDEWIVERSGIRERRIGGATSSLAVAAGAAALKKAGLGPDAIDLLVLCTTTPDQQVPATSAVVQHDLGLACGAFDLNAACSGFVYGLVTAYQFVASGSAERALLIGSETLSRITDWNDRSTAVLFADGAGAVVVEAADDGGRGSHLLAWDLGCDGSAAPILDANIGGFIHMEGREVFRRAVRVMIDSGRRTMERAGLTADDIAL